MSTWNVTNLLGAQVDTVDSTQKFNLGERCHARHVTGDYIGEFVYMQGVGNNAIGLWVLLNYDDGIVSLLVDGDIGGVGISMSAAVASTYGWFQTCGKGLGMLAAGVADNAALFIDAGGVAQATATGKSEIIGARAAAASGSSAANTEVEIDHPVVGSPVGA